jgi:hypothetical protein
MKRNLSRASIMVYDMRRAQGFMDVHDEMFPIYDSRCREGGDDLMFALRVRYKIQQA